MARQTAAASANVKQRGALWQNSSDLMGGDPAALQGPQRGRGEFRRDGHQQAARSLRVKEQITIFRRHVGSKLCTVSHEGPIVLEATG